jgi:hypothetical protein
MQQDRLSSTTLLVRVAERRLFCSSWWRWACRRMDVYAGVDVFARDRPRLSYDAGLGCARGMEQAANCGLSVALFAPGAFRPAWPLNSISLLRTPTWLCAVLCNVHSGWTLENGGGGGTSPEVIESQFWEGLHEVASRVKEGQ